MTPIRRAARSVCGALVLGLLLGQALDYRIREPVPPPSDNKSAWEDWDPDADGVLFRVESHQEAFQVGSKIELQVGIANLSGRMIHIWSCHGWEWYSYDVHVFQEDGTEVRPANRPGYIAQCFSLHPMRIPPGEGFDDTIPLSRRFDLEKPGKYRIRARGHVGARILDSNEGIGGWVHADDLTITVYPRPEAR